MCQKKPFYITTPIYYPSGNPHIGHCYTTVACDSIARYRRMQGYDVMFLTGTDEHGLKIEQKAAEKGVTPKEYVDEIVKTFKGLWKFMNISYDRYIRTTDDYHIETVQKIFKELYDKGYIYKGEYKGKYCTPCESFWTESQLIDGKCPECGREVTEAKEEAYFFKMSPFADRIEKLLTETDYLQPKTRAVELVNNFIKPGLEDLCVSRTTFKWGIPVTFDEKHIVYVWIDALSNYISALGYKNEKFDEFDKYWPADVHMVAKDIMRFHAIIWPAMLMALDLPLPKQVFGHPWLLQGDGKMSKSKGNVIYADDLVDLFGVDAVRFFVLHEMPFENDGVITWELLVERMNSELANTLGNLVNRTISMSNKYFGGVVNNTGVAEEVDEELKKFVLGTMAKVDAKMEELRVADAMTEIFNLFKRCNKYIDETMPWALAKDEAKKERLETVLYNLVESILIGAELLESFMPETAERIRKQLNAQPRGKESLNTFGLYPSGNKVTEAPEILFARLDVKEVMEKVEEIRAKQKVMAEAEAAANGSSADNAEAADGANDSSASKEAGVDVEKAPEITIDDFFKTQLRIGQIIKCENVEKSKKLLCSQVRMGSEVRQIVSGLRPYYTAEEMVGKKVVVVANLKPAKLAGVLSEGMLLCAEDAEGKPVLLTAEKDVPNGVSIG